MKIAITGTRGIPNQYGGFEQFAEFLSFGLANWDTRYGSIIQVFIHIVKQNIKELK